MGQNLTLRCLVRVQVGAKMGKLALLGGLRGTKLELKGALEAPKEAPKEPRRATSILSTAARRLILGLGGSPNKYLSKLRYC